MAQVPVLNALQTFVSAARHLNFSQAAKELGVSPSAVSHQIRMLEEYLGQRLFVRGPRSLSLTDEGTFLFQNLQMPFWEIDNALRLMRDGRGRNSLNVVLRPFFSKAWLAPRLNNFWSAFPKIELNLVHSRESQELDFNACDIAIIWGSGDWNGLSTQLLVPGDLTPILHRTLYDRVGPIKSPDDLGRLTLLHEESRSNWARWFAVAGTPNVTGASNPTVDDTNVRYQSMMAGQGVMLGCPSLLKSELATGELVRPFQERLDLFNYYLAYPAHKPLTSRGKRFIEWISDQAVLS